MNHTILVVLTVIALLSACATFKWAHSLTASVILVCVVLLLQLMGAGR